MKKWKDAFEGSRVINEEQRRAIDDKFRIFCQRYTSAEVFKICQEGGVEAAVVNNVRDVVEDPHLRARNYFVPIHHPELDATFLYPSVPWKFSEMSFDFHRAPHIGEHNDEIYLKEFKLSRDELIALKQAGVI